MLKGLPYLKKARSDKENERFEQEVALKAYRTFRNLLIASTFQTPLLEKGVASNDAAAAARGEAIRKGSKAGLGKAAQAKAAAAAKKAKEATAKAAKKAAAEALHAKKLARQATFGGRGKQHALSSIFGKTYYELQGWTHVFHVFGRVIFWHCCAFHALLMIAFWEADWDNLSVVCITHALGKIVRQLIDARIGHPPRWAGSVVPSFRQKGRSQSLTEHVSICLLYSLIPICYFTEKALRPGGVLSSRSDDPDTNSWGGSTRVYDVISVAYVATFAGSWLLHTKPGQRLRSLWRTKHMNHIGNETQLDVPFDTWLTYSVFWSVVLVFKLMFGWLLISPLATQVRGIINYEHFAYIGMEGSECKNHYSCLTFNSVMRAVMVALRCVVPFLVFQFDTYIFFNICSSVRRAILAQFRAIMAQFCAILSDGAPALYRCARRSSRSAASSASSRSGSTWWRSCPSASTISTSSCSARTTATPPPPPPPPPSRTRSTGRSRRGRPSGSASRARGTRWCCSSDSTTI